MAGCAGTRGLRRRALLAASAPCSASWLPMYYGRTLMGAPYEDHHRDQQCLLRAAKRMAAERDTTLRTIVETALRRYLEAVPAEARPRLRRHTFADAACSRAQRERLGDDAASGPTKAAARERGRHQHPGSTRMRERLDVARGGRSMPRQRGRSDAPWRSRGPASTTLGRPPASRPVPPACRSVTAAALHWLACIARQY